MKSKDIEFARYLRKNQTDAEKIIWNNLRNRQLNGFKFRRQYPISPYLIDFICLEEKVIVEIDGGQHGGIQDKNRDQILSEMGFVILRFWNNEVFKELDSVLEKILEVLEKKSPHPNPLPEGEGIRGRKSRK